MSDETLLYNQFYSTLLRSDLLIRRAVENDAQQLLNLINDVMSNGQSYLTNKLPFTLKQEIEYLSRAGDNYFVLVAETQNAFLGWVTITRNHGNFGKHVAQTIIGVDENFRDQGVGSGLMKQAEQEAKKLGIERLEVVVRSNNQLAVQFFQQNGFFVEGKKTRSVKQKDHYEDELMMAKVGLFKS